MNLHKSDEIFVLVIHWNSNGSDSVCNDEPINTGIRRTLRHTCNDLIKNVHQSPSLFWMKIENRITFFNAELQGN